VANVPMRGSDNDAAPAALRRFIARTGMSDIAVARKAGYRFSSGLQRFVRDDYPNRYFQVKIVDKLAKVLVGRGTPPISAEEFYLKLAGLPVPLYVAKQPNIDMAEVSPNTRTAPDVIPLAPESVARDIPVYGVAAAGRKGDFTRNGEIVDQAKRFAGIAHRQGVFAIYVMGNSMHPWRDDGDLVYIDTVKSPKEGDYVLVECAGKPGEPGAAYLKKLLTRTRTLIRLAQFNPARKIEIPLALVIHIYRVIDWKELLGL
jgi:phage repressor protein C with HTH and peptisase S24 domain